MILLTSFAATDGGEAVKIVLDVDGAKETYVIAAADHFMLALRKGEVGEEEYLSVQVAADRYRATCTAIRCLRAGRCSAQRLYVKLLQKRVKPADAQYAVAYVQKHGYIDEKEQIESYLRELIGHKCMGRHKIVPTLLAKGYRLSEIQSVLEEKYTDQDFDRAKEAFLTKKFGKLSPESREEAEEMKKALYKWGF